MAPVQALSTVLLLATMLVVGSSAREAPPSSVYSFELIHVDATNGSGFSKDDELARGADDAYLDTASYSKKEYLMELKIGTPATAKSFKAVVDTGSDVIWTTRMELCDPSAVSSFAKKACSSHTGCSGCANEQCVFHKTYGSKKLGAEGVMANDMLTLSRRTGRDEEVQVPISFGCANKCLDDKGGDDCQRLIPASAEGIVGLNRGPQSLLKQLGVSKISYCLSDPLKHELSPLWFGGNLKLRSRRWWLFRPKEAIVQTTPLVKTEVKDTSVWANKYYIELEGISVGHAGVKVNLPKEGADFNHKSTRLGGNNKGVMIVDSGNSYSHLESAVFDVLVDLLEEHLKAKASDKKTSDKKHSRACFPAAQFPPPGERPDLVLHFSDGAAMLLPWNTYMLEPKQETPEFCTAIINSKRDISILGNLQQRNMHMLFDLAEGAEKLSFVPVPDCSKLIEAKM